jgi:hypothetical protein
MSRYLKRKDGRIIEVPDGTSIDRRALRSANALRDDFSLPNDVDAILTADTCVRMRRRARNHAEAWGS